MQFKSKLNMAFVISVSITTIFCSAKFRITKWNMCPPEESKFLTLVKISLDVCVDECFRRKHCFAVGYKRLYTLCELYTDFTSASTNRGHCVIVKKDDIKNPDELHNSVCDEWEVLQSNGTGVTCVHQECKEEEILENESCQGNLNEIGYKRILSRTQCGWQEVEAQKCSSGGIWEITETKWEIGSTVEMCSSVVAKMTQLYCSQLHVQIWTTEMSQPDARKFCSDIGGKLAKVDEDWKFNAIQTLIRDCPALNTGQYWVDGYNANTGKDDWKFSDNTLVPMDKHFWKDNAPNDGNGISVCFRMVRHSTDKLGDHRFDDYTCSAKFGYICQQK